MCRPSGAIIASLVAVSAVWSVAALADCTLPSTPNDGYFDQTWAGNGCITFNVDNRNAAATGALQKIVVTGNDNLLIGGDISSGSVSWWIGELTAQGAFDTTFGDSDASAPRRFRNSTTWRKPMGRCWCFRTTTSRVRTSVDTPSIRPASRAVSGTPLHNFRSQRLTG
jgi:hypothetical protein